MPRIEITQGRPNTLYRFYDASDQLLYIGITIDPPSRFRKHRETQEWWPMVAVIRLAHYTSREELRDAEREAIRAERPLYNVADAGPGQWVLVEYSEPGEVVPDMPEPWRKDPGEEASDRALDELFAAVAATGITDDPKRAIEEYRRGRRENEWSRSPARAR